MTCLSTKYLLLKQSGPIPGVLKEYADAGGDKTKVLVLDWPYPYVNKYDARPPQDKIGGFEYVLGAVEELNLDGGYVITDKGLRVSFEELVVGPIAETALAESRGLKLGDQRVTFLRTRRGVKRWVRRSLEGIYSEGEEDSKQAEEKEVALLWNERIREARARCAAAAARTSSDKSAARCPPPAALSRSQAGTCIEATRKRVVRVVRRGFVHTVVDGLG